MPLNSVYYHFLVSEHHEPIHIVVSISMGGWSMYFIAHMEFVDIATKALATLLDWQLRRNLWIMPLRSVYHHLQVSWQHESIQIAISISTGGWRMHFITTMDLIDINKIALVNHFGLTSDVQTVDNAIEECLTPLSSVWTTCVHPHYHIHIHGCL